MFLIPPPMKQMIRELTLWFVCYAISTALLADDSAIVFKATMQANGVLMLHTAIEFLSMPDDFWQ